MQHPGAEFLGGGTAFAVHYHRLNSRFLRALQRVHARAGAEHQPDLPAAKLPGLLPVDQRLQVGSAAGHQYRYLDHLHRSF